MSLTAATDLLAAVRAAGGDLLAIGDRLKVTAPAPLSADLMEQLRAAKPQLLAVLSAPDAGTWTDDHDERAAIVQEGAGCPRAWAEALGCLDASRPLGDVPPARWRTFLDDAGRFLDTWAARAVELGWQPVDLFGCDRARPFARIDRAGLVWLLAGRKLIALTSESGAGLSSARDVRGGRMDGPAGRA